MASAVERLEQFAEWKGWRLEWRTVPWPTYGWELRVLDIFHGKERIGGASCTVPNSDNPNKSSETCAKLIIDALPGAGVSGDGQLAA